MLSRKTKEDTIIFYVHETVESLGAKTDTALRITSTGMSLSETHQKAAPDFPSRLMFQRECFVI